MLNSTEFKKNCCDIWEVIGKDEVVDRHIAQIDREQLEDELKI